MPLVSVVMSVHNGAPWVKDAIGSVLAQTLTDLEVLVIDDGSTDGTDALLRAIGDPRVLVERQARRGLTSSLARATRRARAPVLARLDADDLAAPERLARQVAFLEAHPDVGVLGTAAREVDAGGKDVRLIRPPTDDAGIRRALIRRNPFVHSSVVMRRQILEAAGGYDERLAVAQDYDLWMRLARITRLANLPEPLVVRRLLPGRVSAVRDTERLRAEAAIRWRAVRQGAYPRWCLIFCLRPFLASLLPSPLRRAARRALAGSNSRSIAAGKCL